MEQNFELQNTQQVQTALFKRKIARAPLEFKCSELQQMTIYGIIEAGETVATINAIQTGETEIHIKFEQSESRLLPLAIHWVLQAIPISIDGFMITLDIPKEGFSAGKQKLYYLQQKKQIISYILQGSKAILKMPKASYQKTKFLSTSKIILRQGHLHEIAKKLFSQLNQQDSIILNQEQLILNQCYSKSLHLSNSKKTKSHKYQSQVQEILGDKFSDLICDHNNIKKQIDQQLKNSTNMKEMNMLIGIGMWINSDLSVGIPQYFREVLKLVSNIQPTNFYILLADFILMAECQQKYGNNPEKTKLASNLISYYQKTLQDCCQEYQIPKFTIIMESEVCLTQQFICHQSLVDQILREKVLLTEKNADYVVNQISILTYLKQLYQIDIRLSWAQLLAKNLKHQPILIKGCSPYSMASSETSKPLNVDEKVNKKQQQKYIKQQETFQLKTKDCQVWDELCFDLIHKFAIDGHKELEICKSLFIGPYMKQENDQIIISKT